MVIEARPGQSLQLRVRASNGNDREPKDGDAEPESGSVTVTVADAPTEIGRKPDIPPNQFLVSFHETPWKEILLWYDRHTITTEKLDEPASRHDDRFLSGTLDFEVID